MTETAKAFYTLNDIARLCDKSLGWVKRQMAIGNLTAKKVIIVDRGYVMGGYQSVKRIKWVVNGKDGKAFIENYHQEAKKSSQETILG